MYTKRIKLKLDDYYQIEIDEYNFTLMGKNKQGKLRRNFGHYPTLDLLLEDLFYCESLRRIMSSKLEDIKGLQNIYLDTKEWFLKLVESLDLKCDTSLLKPVEAKKPDRLSK